ncbi:hypothetical protein JJQ72_10730 [Paenibacillus sp. F411]|uniref:hypothetical protein n=1 Tax=Paenibacillus sp. F411 TaxID=2820239 RepID=UPI001AAE87F8|nr:hypothetical protein [Paenibacillus sp. F411]MBO2944444.1 hypothetical protein [Paenibacillus sp. F411]
MVQCMKRYVMTFAAVVVTFVGLTGIRIDIHASSADPLISTVPKSIKKYVHSINSEDWESYVNSYSPDRRLTNFPSEAQRNSRTGILSVKSIEISEIKEISEKDIHEVQPYFSEIDKGLYQGVRYFYVGLNYHVHHENEFFYNGVRYETFAVGTLHGEEYILGNEFVYNFDPLQSSGYAFGSAAEREAIIREERRLGGNSKPPDNGEIQPQRVVSSIIISFTNQNHTIGLWTILREHIQEIMKKAKPHAWK